MIEALLLAYSLIAWGGNIPERWQVDALPSTPHVVDATVELTDLHTGEVTLHSPMFVSLPWHYSPPVGTSARVQFRYCDPTGVSCTEGPWSSDIQYRVRRNVDTTRDGVVGVPDFAKCVSRMGSNHRRCDTSGDGIVDATDHRIWQSGFGAVVSGKRAIIPTRGR